MFGGFVDFLSIGGLPLLFILVFLEGNPFIGSFIPGQIVVVMAGILVSTLGVYTLTSAFLVVFLSAYLGDIFGYHLGKKYGVGGLKKFGINEKSGVYTSSKSFFEKYGSWSIILGREFNLTRAFIPFLAGVCKMNFGKFLFVSFISCFFWTTLSILLGFYFGTIVLEKLDFIFQFIIFILIYGGILFLIYKNFKNFYHENFLLIKKYALHNLLSFSFLIIFTITLMLLYYFNFLDDFNRIFEFLNFSFFSISFKFIPSLNGIFALILFIFMFILIYPLKNRMRILVLFMWSLLIAGFITAIVWRLIFLWFGIKLFVSVIFLSILIFYLSVLIRNSLKDKKSILIWELVLIFILIFIFLVKFSLTGNFFLTLLSFVVGVLECELILILSHYQILDSYFSKSIN